MKIKVTAQAYDRCSRVSFGEVRVEEIDTEDNILFKDCLTIKDVKEGYESFWNDINRESAEMVGVIGIEEG